MSRLAPPARHISFASSEKSSDRAEGAKFDGKVIMAKIKYQSVSTRKTFYKKPFCQPVAERSRGSLARRCFRIS